MSFRKVECMNQLRKEEDKLRINKNRLRSKIPKTTSFMTILLVIFAALFLLLGTVTNVVYVGILIFAKPVNKMPATTMLSSRSGIATNRLKDKIRAYRLSPWLARP